MKKKRDSLKWISVPYKKDDANSSKNSKVSARVENKNDNVSLDIVDFLNNMSCSLEEMSVFFQKLLILLKEKK